MPKRVKRRKQFRGRMTGKAMKGNKIAYGEYGLVAQEPCWMTANQIEAGRIAINRYTKRGGKVWVNVFPHKPVSKKPIGTRMGKGKGAPEYWVAVIKPGRVLFELSGVSEEAAKELIIMGFVNAFREELPMEYAVELNRLLALNIGDKK